MASILKSGATVTETNPNLDFGDAMGGYSGLNNVSASDDLYATASVNKYSTEPNFNYLVVKNFDFSGIPAGATIDGIEVVIEAGIANTGSTTSIFVPPRYVLLTKDGVNQVGSNMGQETASVSNFAADVTSTRGGPTNQWGTTWTAADVKNANFGVQIATTGLSNSGVRGVFRVDLVQIRVYYTATVTSTQVSPGTVLAETQSTKVPQANSTSNAPTMASTQALLTPSVGVLAYVTAPTLSFAETLNLSNESFAALTPTSVVVDVLPMYENLMPPRIGGSDSVSVPKLTMLSTRLAPGTQLPAGPNAAGRAYGYTNYNGSPIIWTESDTGYTVGSTGTNYVNAQDALYATQVPGSTVAQNEQLQISKFFNEAFIPDDAIVRGITVTVRRYASTGSAIADSVVQLSTGIPGNSLIGTNKAGGQLWGNTFSTVTYGGSTDTWGATITGAMLKSQYFGVVMQLTGNGSSVAKVDYATMTANWYSQVAVPKLSQTQTGLVPIVATVIRMQAPQVMSETCLVPQTVTNVQPGTVSQAEALLIPLTNTNTQPGTKSFTEQLLTPNTPTTVSAVTLASNEALYQPKTNTTTNAIALVQHQTLVAPLVVQNYDAGSRSFNYSFGDVLNDVSYDPASKPLTLVGTTVLLDRVFDVSAATVQITGTNVLMDNAFVVGNGGMSMSSGSSSVDYTFHVGNESFLYSMNQVAYTGLYVVDQDSHNFTFGTIGIDYDFHVEGFTVQKLPVEIAMDVTFDVSTATMALSTNKVNEDLSFDLKSSLVEIVMSAENLKDTTFDPSTRAVMLTSGITLEDRTIDLAVMQLTMSKEVPLMDTDFVIANFQIDLALNTVDAYAEFNVATTDLTLISTVPLRDYTYDLDETNLTLTVPNTDQDLTFDVSNESFMFAIDETVIEFVLQYFYVTTIDRTSRQVGNEVLLQETVTELGRLQVRDVQYHFLVDEPLTTVTLKDETLIVQLPDKPVLVVTV